MNIEIRHSPAYAVAYCTMASGEVVRTEAGSMVAMSGGIHVKADAGPGGVARGLMRKALVGEGLFMSKYEAVAHGAWVAVAPTFPGDLVVVPIDTTTGERGVVAESGSLLALGGDVHADPRWAGLGMIVMREGATMIHLHGRGEVVLAAYGGIHPFVLAAGQTLVFDTGHVVAFTAGMNMRVGVLSSVLTSALSREGLVSEITGPGTVWTQTRSIIDKGSWLMPNKQPRGRQ